MAAQRRVPRANAASETLLIQCESGGLYTVFATRSALAPPTSSDPLLRIGRVRARVPGHVAAAARAGVRRHGLCRQHGAGRLYGRPRRRQPRRRPPRRESDAPARGVRHRRSAGRGHRVHLAAAARRAGTGMEDDSSRAAGFARPDHGDPLRGRLPRADRADLADGIDAAAGDQVGSGPAGSRGRTHRPALCDQHHRRNRRCAACRFLSDIGGRRGAVVPACRCYKHRDRHCRGYRRILHAASNRGWGVADARG